MESRKKIINTFREKGFRATPQRIAIAQAVLSSKKHPTVEQVHEMVRRNHPSISLSTVYNTLHTMKYVNMVQELAFSDNSRFDANTNIHVNLMCEKCREVIDIESDAMEIEVVTISKRRGFTITGHRFDIYGVCRKCSL